jgi:glycerophosphoryl diester phosphodiesterase
MGIILVLILFLALLFTGCGEKRSEQVVIIAHRGASQVAPENTLAALKKAVELGAEYAEVDVFQTKDGEIVLMHDEKLERTTNVKGKIWDFTREELKQLDAGSWFGREFKGEPIPTLHEAIQLVRGRMKLNIEIKIKREEPEIAQKVLDLIRAEEFEKDCVITSFDRKTVEKIKQIAPHIETGFIFDEDYPAGVFEGSWDALCCDYRLVNKEFISKARENRKKIYAWTVNSRRVMRRLIDLKIDGIITNRPGLLKKVLKEQGQKHS